MAGQVIALYNIPADPDAFNRHYAETHIPLGKKMPGLRSFVVSKGPVMTPQGTSPYHQVAVLTFDSLDALQAALASPEGQAAAADGPNFAQAGVTVLMFETRDA